MTKKNEKKTVEVGRKRVPLRKILHNKEIRVAAKALEDFRLTLIEQEFLLGAKIILQINEYGECIAVAKRPETDNEYAKRLEKARLAEEAKKERERKRKIAEAEKAKLIEVSRKRNAINTVENWIRNHDLTIDDLASVLKQVDKTK
jgi:hypothetical protein